MRPNTYDDFWNFVQKGDGCWIWIGSLMNAGYGHFHINGKSRRAHRVAYELSNGKIPRGLLICHHCDNRKCVNPKHLFLGDFGDNNRDTVAKGRYNSKSGKQTHCKKGHPLSGDNLYVNPASDSRVCRACSAISKLTWQRRTRDLQRQAHLHRLQAKTASGKAP